MEGFFVSSVEFCKHVKFDDKDRKDHNRDSGTGPQGPAGPVGPAGPQGPAGGSGNNNSTLVNTFNCTNTNNININTDNNSSSSSSSSSGLQPIQDTIAQGLNGTLDGLSLNKTIINLCVINDNDSIVIEDAGNGTEPEPPIPNPKITVTKEMFICNEPTVTPAGSGGGFEAFTIECNDSTGNIPAPDSPVWVPWEDCNVDGFCPFFNEANFTMQIEQNPGPNFIRFEFPGTSEGRSVNVESGTYQIIEEGNIEANPCPNPYEGNVGIGEIQTPVHIAFFCFKLEGDCSGTIEAGEEKACTIKNYLDIGQFQVPSETLTASNINTDTSEFQGTADSSELTALEKIEKLKAQSLNLLS